MRELLEKISEIWGRVLSPIETQKIINLCEEFGENIILEAAMISSSKTYPMQYMCKVLYYVKNPIEATKKKEEVQEPVQTNSKWLEEFEKRFS